MQHQLNFNLLCKILIAIAIIANCSGFLFPLTEITFGPYYASIAKHIALSGNWADLILSNKDWLDKPHLPFWLSAISFKLFGINSAAYILPGFIFHLIGAAYTYRLTNYLYSNKSTALLATLIYLTTLHLMMSAIDVRAEAYLLGTIMPAVYYWLNYNDKFSYSALLLGALFTGLAIMTKGIFVVITIISGLVCLWIYQRQWKNFISLKWIFALVISFIFVIPELIALYLQFDLHPEKVIYGNTHVSGIKWFFWDSQFGRFFNTGAIYSSNPPPLHHLFFIHTFLWAFLPWSLIYPVAVYRAIKKFKLDLPANKKATILLLGYFWISFIMFSITSFKVDHYTNIIFPFAAIMCAKWIIDSMSIDSKVFSLTEYLCLILLGLSSILGGLLFSGIMLVIFVGLEILLISGMIYSWGTTPAQRSITLASLSISFVMLFIFGVNGVYSKYDIGLQAAQLTNKNPQTPVVDYLTDSRSLEFFSQNKYYKFDNLSATKSLEQFYLVIPAKSWTEISNDFAHSQVISTIHANKFDRIVKHLASKHLANHLESFNIVLIKTNATNH